MDGRGAQNTSKRCLQVWKQEKQGATLGERSGFVLCNLCLMLQQNLFFVPGFSKMKRFAVPLMRESKGHFDSLEIPRNVKKKKEENSTRKDT